MGKRRAVHLRRIRSHTRIGKTKARTISETTIKIIESNPELHAHYLERVSNLMQSGMPMSEKLAKLAREETKKFANEKGIPWSI